MASAREREYSARGGASLRRSAAGHPHAPRMATAFHGGHAVLGGHVARERHLLPLVRRPKVKVGARRSAQKLVSDRRVLVCLPLHTTVLSATEA
mmetsp:Transcript_5892/g.13676  ORF Transcript_5892/g.13676 Transcript_5892/m.13676 type:complete len:94 (+) Transcript_5892:245-526(+)